MSVTCAVQSAMLPLFRELTFKFVWSAFYGYTNLTVIVFGFDKNLQPFFFSVLLLFGAIFFFLVLQSRESS